MPKVTLEFEVTQKGVSAKQVVSETETALARLGNTAVATARQHDQLAKSSEGAALSTRTLRSGINDIAMAFGSSSPAIANVALGLGHFSDRMAGASTSAKVMGGAVVAAASTVAFLMTQFKETERIAERFSTIDRAVQGLDFGTIRSGLMETNIQTEVLLRTTNTWIGAELSGLDNIKRKLLGLPSDLEEIRLAQDKLRAGAATAMHFAIPGDEAMHAAEMSGATIGMQQQRLGSLISQNLASGDTVSAFSQAITVGLQSQFDALKKKLELDTQGLMAKANAAGTVQFEGPRILAAQANKEAELREKLNNQIAAVGEQARQQIEGIRARAESARAFGAGQDVSYAGATAEAAQLAAAGGTGDSLRQAQLQAMLLSARYARTPGASLVQGGAVNTDLIYGPQVDARQRAAIRATETAKLASIEETYTKELWSIDQLKLQDSDREEARGRALRIAEQDRQNALQESLNKERELEAQVTQSYIKSLEAAGAAIDTNLSDKLDKARASAAALSGTGGSDSDWKIGALSQPHWSPGSSMPSSGPGSASWWSGGAWGTGSYSGTGNIGSGGGVPSTIPAFDVGGVMPGPVGRPGLAILHGGETVTPARGRGGDLVVMMTFNGRDMFEAIRVPLEDAMSAGRVQVPGIRSRM